MCFSCAPLFGHFYRVIVLFWLCSFVARFSFAADFLTKYLKLPLFHRISNLLLMKLDVSSSFLIFGGLFTPIFVSVSFSSLIHSTNRHTDLSWPHSTRLILSLVQTRDLTPIIIAPMWISTVTWIAFWGGVL